jgi:hypothetical protein
MLPEAVVMVELPRLSEDPDPPEEVRETDPPAVLLIEELKTPS